MIKGKTFKLQEPTITLIKVHLLLSVANSQSKGKEQNTVEQVPPQGKCSTKEII